MPERLDYYAPTALSTAFYDLVAHCDPTLVGEVDFYADLIPAGSWVLELGCGTGRISLPLAERNLAVVGLDLAPAMLARAQAKRESAAPELRERTAFVQGDMTTFALNHQFDAVIAPFFSFSHLPRGASRRRAMERIAKHLRPGGLCALHAIPPEMPAGAVDPQRAVLDVAYGDAGERLRLYVTAESFDRTEGRFDQQLDYVVVDGEGRETRRSPEQFSYYASNLENDARGSGLALQRKIAPFAVTGEMWIFRRN